MLKKALVVGIDDYDTCPLYGCVNDAEAVADILKQNGDEEKTINFDVLKHLNVENKGHLKHLIINCFSGDAEVALFYFSGHGYVDSTGGYIVTPDCSECDVGVSMQDLLNIVNNSKCKNKVVILDCCYSGYLGQINVNQQSSVIGDGVTLLTACRSDEPAMEFNGHGLFTSLLLEALSGGAADVTGYITPGGIYSYIDKSLGAWDQRPIFKTNISSFSPLRQVTPRVSKEVLRRLTDYFKTPDSKLLLDPSYEPTNSPVVEHKIIEPYAESKHVKIFSDLQKLASVGLVVPLDEEHMYFAAMNSKPCRLTSAGQHYWNLVKKERI
ncbi:peptidase C14 [Candidatus Methanomassiliicoccus intestinalis]|nr:MAG: peptidase C14 [Candidatus Methanomassiliicoccus intestinalis]